MNRTHRTSIHKHRIGQDPGDDGLAGEASLLTFHPFLARSIGMLNCPGNIHFLQRCQRRRVYNSPGFGYC